jgi:hypothetical protein
MTGYEDLKPSEIEECKEKDRRVVDTLATFVEQTIRERLMNGVFMQDSIYGWTDETALTLAYKARKDFERLMTDYFNEKWSKR